MLKAKSSTLLRFISAILMMSAPCAAAARTCSEGRSLIQLVNNADAIAVVEELTERPAALGLLRSSALPVHFLEFIKSPVVIHFDRRTPQLVYLDEVRPVPLGIRRPKYLAFLTYLGPNEWQAERCFLLEIMAEEAVWDVCRAIADLFSENAFERERRCLLKYPANAPLPDVKAEIGRTLLDGVNIGDEGKFYQDGRWLSLSEFQLIVFELDMRSRKAVFQTSRNFSSFPIKAYVRSADLSKEKFEKSVHKGAKFHFQGRWERGNLIIEAIDAISGRRPRD